jgi:AraC-like DNA-binding protein
MPSRRSTNDVWIVAEYADLLCRLLEQRGIPRARVLEGTGVTPAMLTDARARLSRPLFENIVRRARALSGDDALGFELGLAMNIKTHGFLGYAALSSETLGDAIDLAVRYWRTRTTALELHYFREGDTVVLQLDERVPLGELLPFAIDALMASFYVIRHQLVREEPEPGMALVTYPARGYHQRLLEMVGNRMQFECSANQMRFPASELSRRIEFADPQLVRMAAAQCEEELKKLRDEAGLLGDVRARVRRHLKSGATLERIAGEMHMAPRTLRRRLDELGISFHEIVEQMRRGMAVERLRDGNEPVDEIAVELGYSDPSNFARAFRRWMGVAPGRYRAQSRGEG